MSNTAGGSAESTSSSSIMTVPIPILKELNKESFMSWMFLFIAHAASGGFKDYLRADTYYTGEGDKKVERALSGQDMERIGKAQGAIIMAVKDHPAVLRKTFVFFDPIRPDRAMSVIFRACLLSDPQSVEDLRTAAHRMSQFSMSSSIAEQMEAAIEAYSLLPFLGGKASEADMIARLSARMPPGFEAAKVLHSSLFELRRTVESLEQGLGQSRHPNSGTSASNATSITASVDTPSNSFGGLGAKTESHAATTSAAAPVAAHVSGFSFGGFGGAAARTVTAAPTAPSFSFGPSTVTPIPTPAPTTAAIAVGSLGAPASTATPTTAPGTTPLFSFGGFGSTPATTVSAPPTATASGATPSFSFGGFGTKTEAPRPAAPSPASATPTFSFGAAPSLAPTASAPPASAGGLLGAAPSATQPAPATSGFVFGSTPVAKSVSEQGPVASGFSGFGAPSSTATPAPAAAALSFGGGFWGFGGQPAGQTPGGQGSCGASDLGQALSGFSIQQPSTLALGQQLPEPIRSFSFRQKTQQQQQQQQEQRVGKGKPQQTTFTFGMPTPSG